MNILPYNKKFFYSTIPIRKMVLKLRNNFPYLFCNLLTKKIHVLNVNKKSFSTIINKNYLRNIGVIAHVDAGKTTLTENILFHSGINSTIGDINRGDTVMDFLELERKRGITIQSACITFNWKQHQINLIDTPGHVDFTIEVERSIRVLDGAIAVLDASSGVQSQTETVWKQANRYCGIFIEKPLINSWIKYGASFKYTIEMIKERLKAHLLILQIPFFQSKNFIGVVDLINMKILEWSGEFGEIITRKEIKDQKLKTEIIKARQELFEQLSEVDDEFMQFYLENGEQKLTEKMIQSAIRRATISLKGVPILCGSALKRKGVQPIMDAITDYLPSPTERPPIFGKLLKSGKLIEIKPTENSPLCALAFKVIHDIHKGLIVYLRIYSGILKAGTGILCINSDKREKILQLFKVYADQLKPLNELRVGDVGAVIGLKYVQTGDTITNSQEKNPIQLDGIVTPPPVFFCSIEPEKLSDEKNLNEALQLLRMEDPSFHISTNFETGQLLISGMGELHLEIIKDRILNHYKVAANIGKMYISYKSTIITDIQEKHTTNFEVSGKTTSATITMTIKSNERGKGNTFNFDISKKKMEMNLVSLNLQDISDSIRGGVKSALDRGVLGYPMIDIDVTIDSIEVYSNTTIVAFRRCAYEILMKVANQSIQKLLEPIMKLEISLSNEYLGIILSNLSSQRRAHINEVIENTDFFSGTKIIAYAPLKEMIGFSTDLRSMTKGSASFTMQFERYGDMSINEQKQIIGEI